MYKLNGRSLEKGVWFDPESQPLTLTERNSTSSITLGPDGPEIGFTDWILDEEWPEGPIVWRVKSIDDQTDTETVTVGLEHVIRTLEDTKLFEEVDAGTIAGGGTCTARQAIEYLMSQQSDWVLGELEGDRSLPYEFSGGESLLDAIESVSDTIEDAEWWYDLTQYPFVLHIRRRNSAVMSEMRGGRNVSTLRRSINRTGMYTRIYPVGRNDLHISEEYISQNEGLYGRVDKVETDQGKTSEDSLRAWASAMLRKHCEPLVTITIGGLELSQETGEALDWIQVNRVCRCPLPEFHTTILERVIKKAWRDRKKDPESVTVTLGNNAADVRDLTKTIEEASKSSGRGARGQAKQNYLFEANGEHLLYEVFDECGHLHGVLRMTEQSLRVAFENLNECTRSEFRLTSESLRIQFENELASTRSEFQMTSESLRVQFENDIGSTRSEFQMTSESLRAEFQNEINSTRSEFQVTSESLRVQFEDEIASTRLQIEASSESLRSTITDSASGLQTQIDQNKEDIRLRVMRGDVGTQLAIELDNVHITGGAGGGGNLVVDGYVTSEGLSSAIGDIENLMVQNLGAAEIDVEGDIGANGGYFSSLEVNGNDVSNPITSASVSGNTLTLSYADGTTAATFNKATTLEGAWSSGRLTVTAYQNNSGTRTSVGSYVSAHEIGLNGNGSANFSAELKTQDTGENAQTVRLSKYIYLKENVNGASSTVVAGENSDGSSPVGSISTGATYQAGVTAGQNNVTITKGSWDGGQIQFTKSAGTASTKGVRVGLSGSWNGNNYEYTIKDYYDNAQGVSTGYTGTIDASARYTAGVTAGKDAVTVTKGSWSGGQIQFGKSEGTASTKGVRVGLSGSWSGNTYSYTIKDYYDNSSGVSTGYTGTIDATARYNAGVNAGGATARLRWDGSGNTGTASTISVDNTYSIVFDNSSGNQQVTQTWYVSKPSLQAKTVTENGTVTPDSGYYGLSSVTVDVSSSHNISCSSNVQSIGTNRGNRTNAGSISKSGLTANSYLGFAISCGGSTKYFYITVNA